MNVLVILHVLGALTILIGWIGFRAGRLGRAPMLWGARAQIVTGLILVGLAEAGDETVNHGKVGVKLVVALAVAACAEISAARAKKGDTATTLVDVAGGLTIVNILVATLWN